jgi:CRISPR type I-E-associated protein CasB/Cse2
MIDRSSDWPGKARTWWWRNCSLDGPPKSSASKGWTPDPAIFAKLRRCRDRVDAFMVPEALLLGRTLAPTSTVNDKLGTAVDLARVLAHVKNDSTEHPMRAVGWPSFPRDGADSGDRPKLAETRFKRLLQATDGEERVDAFVRLIALMGGQANVKAISEAFLWWNHPSGIVRRDWAFEYFNAATAAPLAALEHLTEESAES